MLTNHLLLPDKTKGKQRKKAPRVKEILVLSETKANLLSIMTEAKNNICKYGRRKCKMTKQKI